MKNSLSGIGFIGAGNMATAIISGLLRQNYPFNKIFAISPEDSHLKKLENEFSVNVTSNNKQLIASSSTIILAIKPNVMPDVLDEIKEHISPQHRIISIVAGYELKKIERSLSQKITLLRAMPNTPASLGLGVTALTHNKSVKKVDVEAAEYIFQSIGITCWLKEKDFDLYTALIGSGPAYIFYIIEAMINASKDLDLEEDKKKELIIEMIKGSSSLAKMSDDGLETLRNKVTSKGGVTERAIEILDESEMKEVLLKAILEGAKRSKILGEEKNE